MQIEIVIIAVIVFTIMTVGGQININQMISDNQVLFMKLKESDWDFYVRAKYGNQMNPDILYNKRIKNALMVMVLVFMFMIKGMNAVKILIIFVIGYLVFKQPYNDLKNYYKKHIHIIDSMLPYYLKSLEILIQHYTVPVAIAKSIDTAPEIFKPGLRRLVARIEDGDQSVEPYMDFAKEYPVRDSMRMMRLLYRLSLGSQENKQEQLLMFSRTISTLQNKAREEKYKNRLETMEKKTMTMLMCTGGGIIALLLFSLMSMMSI